MTTTPNPDALRRLSYDLWHQALTRIPPDPVTQQLLHAQAMSLAGEADEIEAQQQIRATQHARQAIKDSFNP